jgi:nitrite reductase/ring-hydroxylating ferredoxin subunit
MKLHRAGKKEIGVFRHRGKLYAALNYCSHAGAPVCQGEIDYPLTTEGPGGTTSRDFDHPTIRCPWHHWEFDLQTGNALCPISQRIKTYEIREDEGQVWIDI